MDASFAKSRPKGLIVLGAKSTTLGPKSRLGRNINFIFQLYTPKL